MVDGLRVRTDIPNTDSIDATFNSDEYETLPGLRKVPLADLGVEGDYKSADDNQTVDSLKEKILASGEIAPLIVVNDSKGSYVLEGNHRARALYKMGKKYAPALVVVHYEKDVKDAAFNPDQPRDKDGKWGVGDGSDPASGTSEAVSTVTPQINALPAHPSKKLAEYEGFKAVVNPLNQSGEATRSPAWTDDKPEVEEAFGVYSEAFAKGTVEDVKIDSLVTYQTFVSSDRLRAIAEKGVDFSEPVGVVFHHKGQDWLVDGNHRTTLAKLMGKSHVKLIRIQAVPLTTAALKNPEAPNYKPSVLPAGILLIIDKLKLASRLRALAPKIKGFAFDKSNPKAVQWAEDHATETIDGLSATTRADVKRLIDESMAGDFDVDELTAAITDLIGDSERADLIARTETMRASNEGQKEAWDQAVEDGLLTGTEEQEWIITPDDRLCPQCEPFEDTTAELGGTFEATDGNTSDGPPLHPRCRCTLGLKLGN